MKVKRNYELANILDYGVQGLFDMIYKVQDELDEDDILKLHTKSYM